MPRPPATPRLALALLGQSGDWRMLLLQGGDLLVVTTGDAFDYRLEANC